MKIYAYEVRNDELAYFNEFKDYYQVEVTLDSQIPTLDNAHLTQGYTGVTILGQGTINAPLLDKWYQNGIRLISSRTIGLNHIDVDYAKKLGIRVCHASYPPNGVAEFTVMLLLICLRQYKQALWRGQVNDYSLAGLQGKELHDLTVGVIGTGNIGRTFIKIIQGFGCKVLAYDVHQNEEVKQYATYVDIDTLYHEADVISLHVPLLDSTYHMINKESISKMKDQIIIVNCSRGGLIDTEDIIDAVENKKIGALGLDVIEGEEGITHIDHRSDIIANKNMAYLHQFPNVIMTQHMAFYTNTAVKYMVDSGIGGLVEMSKSNHYPNEV